MNVRGLAVARLLVVAAVLGLAGAAAAQKKDEKAAAKPASAAPAAKQKGYALLKEVRGDFDGDGVEDIVAALSSKNGIQLGVFKDEKGTVTLAHVLPPSGGTELKSLELVHLTPPEGALEAVLEVYGENPDEKLKRIRVYTGHKKPREIFSSVIFRSKDKDQRDEWERTPGLVSYGDARPGWYFDDTEGDGTMEIIVRRDPQLIKVPRDGDDPASLLTGVREVVYEYFGSPDAAVYTERPNKRFTDFLPALPITKVTGSGAWMPKAERADLEADALSAAVYAAAESSDAKAVPEQVEIDLSAYYARVADKNLDTPWIENEEKGFGKGEWVMLHLEEGASVRMVRIVPGCVADKKSFGAHNLPTKLEIRFDSGEMAMVDLSKPKKPERPVVAMMEVPLKGRDVGAQTLIFFPTEQATKTVKITILDAKKQGKANLTCISEISVH